MPTYQQAISVLLSASVMISVMGLDGCSKKSQPAQSQPAQQEQAPATTYATPTADQLYQLVAPIALFPDNLVAMVLPASRASSSRRRPISRHGTTVSKD